MDLILASSSAYRKALLERLGLPVRCLSPPIDEDVWKRKGLSPESLAEQLAVAKAESLPHEEAGATIVAGDQVLALDGNILGKPGSRQAARQQLAQLAGRRHRLMTAVAVRHQERTRSHVDITSLTMRPLSEAAIARYVAADDPFDCAGSYKIEACGIVLFEHIDSADQTAINGLPLIALTTMLRELGFSIP